MQRIRSTTVVAVRKDGRTALGGDGQVTMGDTVVKTTAMKVRELRGGQILAGFAGAVADAFALFDKLEEKLERYPANLTRALVELAKDWRTDRYLRRLNALLVVADREHVFMISGDGDVIQPDDDVVVTPLGTPAVIRVGQGVASPGASVGTLVRFLEVLTDPAGGELVRVNLRNGGWDLGNLDLLIPVGSTEPALRSFGKAWIGFLGLGADSAGNATATVVVFEP